MSIQTILALCLCVLAALALALWLAGGRYGGLRPSQEATEAYASFHVDPEKHYYSSGPDAFPTALMGMDKSWSLESDLWKHRELTDAAMKELVANMNSKASESLASLHGFDIIDDRGWKIGNWYSIPGLNITVKVIEEKRVSVTTPPLEIYSGR
jgi:hypothetical protein